MTTLTRALDYAGTHDTADIEIGVAEGAFQRWDGDDSVIITEILLTPKRKTLHFFLAEGKLEELRAMVPPILEWGKSIGCTHASLLGRFGWSRTWLVDEGWETRSVLMEKTL